MAAESGALFSAIRLVRLAGNWIATSVPLDSMLLMESSPPCISTRALAMLSPNPSPSGLI